MAVDKPRQHDLAPEVDGPFRVRRGDLGALPLEDADNGTGFGVDLDRHVVDEGLLLRVEEDRGVDDDSVGRHVWRCRRGGRVGGCRGSRSQGWPTRQVLQILDWTETARRLGRRMTLTPGAWLELHAECLPASPSLEHVGKYNVNNRNGREGRQVCALRGAPTGAQRGWGRDRTKATSWLCTLMAISSSTGLEPRRRSRVFHTRWYSWRSRYSNVRRCVDDWILHPCHSSFPMPSKCPMQCRQIL